MEGVVKSGWIWMYFKGRAAIISWWIGREIRKDSKSLA